MYSRPGSSTLNFPLNVPYPVLHGSNGYKYENHHSGQENWTLLQDLNIFFRLYDRHIPIVEKVLTNPQKRAPKLIVDPTVKDFYDFTVDSLRIEDYQAGPQVKDIPVAV